MPSSVRPARPWYEDWEEQCDLAARYISLVKGQPPLTSFQTQELISYHGLSMVRVIFESNRIEDVGLNESDTKKVILSDPNLSDPSRFQQTVMGELKEFKERLVNHRRRGLVVNFEDRKRSIKEVINHYTALALGIQITMERSLASLTIERNPANSWLMSDLKPGELFSETIIRALHYVMANGLIPRDAGVEAGFYRLDARTTDFRTAFPAPENVPAAMVRLVASANSLLRSKENPVMKAARISYDFVAIHPFPDFNGRLSRLLMNMALCRERLPFLAALRGNKKEKHKYLTALRHANRGKITSYAALIAAAVIEGFEEINRNLERAGHSPIKPAR